MTLDEPPVEIYKTELDSTNDKHSILTTVPLNIRSNCKGLPFAELLIPLESESLVVLKLLAIMKQSVSKRDTIALSLTTIVSDRYGSLCSSSKPDKIFSRASTESLGMLTGWRG